MNENKFIISMPHHTGDLCFDKTKKLQWKRIEKCCRKKYKAKFISFLFLNLKGFVVATVFNLFFSDYLEQ